MHCVIVTLFPVLLVCLALY